MEQRQGMKGWRLGVCVLVASWAWGCGGPLLLSGSPCAYGDPTLECCLKEFPGLYDR